MNRILIAFVAALAACGLSAFGATIQTDICVYGATSGGVAAAVQAARLGKSVTLLSTNTHVGGMTSGGLSWTDTGIAASISGVALEFYKRIGQAYNVNIERYWFEPHIAEQQFTIMLGSASVTVRFNQRLSSVTKSAQRITQITMDDGTIYQAGMFIDTSYEGDLMAMAGVSWTIGRESSATYGELFNGLTTGVQGDTNATNLDPYVVPGNPASGLLPLVQANSGGTVGDADTRVQAYNLRPCLTTDTANQTAITAPSGYDETRYELVGRIIDARIAAGRTPVLTDFLTLFSIPGSKFDINAAGIASTDYVGNSASYAAATAAQRTQLASDHLQYLQGLLYYLGHSTRVPVAVRNQMLTYGLCHDEFTDTGGWPQQLYVREGRRMVSDYVMAQQDCFVTRMADDSIGLASYGIDSHHTQRFAKNGAVWSEGGVNRGVFEPYRVSYRSIIPRVGECENLLVPWSLSASHAAFCSIRMEPVFMMLSQSAGAAAAFALNDNVPVQQVNYPKLALQLRADNLQLSWGTAGSLGIVIDNSDSTGVTFTPNASAWTVSANAQGFAGNNYIHDGNTAKGTKSIRFTPTIPATGSYDVYLRWTSDTNRATNVPVDVIHATGTNTYTIDERNNGGMWVKLNTSGPLTLPAGTTAGVLVRTDGTAGTGVDANKSYVIVDAARFVPYTPPDTTVQIVASDPIAREASPLKAARFTVVRSSTQTGSSWSVPYSVSGSASSGVDFNSLSGSVTIPTTQTTATILVTPISDNVIEGDETVTITLAPPAAGSGYIVGALSSATARIIDKPTVQIVATDAIAREADPTDTARLTVSRDASQTANDWTVSYTVSGTATPGSDYTALPGTVLIPAGQTSATIDITAVPDNLAEGDETVTVTLLPDAAVTPGPAASATITILDKPMDAWRFATFTAAQLANPAISGDSADPDNDGISNLAEYALGLDPFVSNPAPTSSSLDATGHVTLTYTSRRSATDVTIFAEGSTDLRTWSNAANMVEEVSRLQQGALDLVTVRLVPSPTPNGFLRVRVTRL